MTQIALTPDETHAPEDDRMKPLVQGNAPLRRLATGFDWVEGPVWFPDRQELLFSDIPSDRILRLTACGQLSVFRAPAGFANGNSRDRQGRLVSCQHGSRSVTRTEWDGSVTTLAASFDGKPLNSPNDVVVAEDGAVWFTDPTYGIGSNFEGYRAEPQQPVRGVYRIPPAGGAPELMLSDFQQPNGLAFNADGSILYVGDSRAGHIRRFRMEGGRPTGGEVFCTPDPRTPDGFRVDALGNVWTSAHDGVHIYAADGTRLGKILVPERVSNLTFGGPRMARLLITATTSVYSIGIGAPV